MIREAAETLHLPTGELLYGLGFSQAMMKRATKDMSGGWRMRVALAQALFVRPMLLVLDEPTNHLDLGACVWLEDYLAGWDSILILTSHSADFLNGVCSKIYHLTVRKTLDLYGGNYASYVKTRAENEVNQRTKYEKEQNDIKHLKEFISSCGTCAPPARPSPHHARHHHPKFHPLSPLHTSAAPSSCSPLPSFPQQTLPSSRHPLNFPLSPPTPIHLPVARRPSSPHPSLARADSNLVKQAQSKQKIIDKMVEAGLTQCPQPDPVFRFGFPSSEKIPPPVLAFQNVSFAYSGKKEDYLYTNLEFGIDCDSRIALVGPNGAGKSTLLKLMTLEIEPSEGDIRRNPHLRIGRRAAHSSAPMWSGPSHLPRLALFICRAE